MSERAPAAPIAPVGALPPSLYERIFDTAADALIVVDPDGRIVLANPQCEELFGYTASEIVGNPVETLIPERFRAGHRHHRSRYSGHMVSRPMGRNLALWARHRDGNEFPVEITLSPFRCEGLALVCANVRDVREVQRAQDLQLRARQSNAVADFGRHALVTKDIAQIQREACRLVGLHLGADCSLVVHCGGPGLPSAGASVGLDETALAATIERLSEQCGPGAESIVEPLVLDELGATPSAAGAPPSGPLRSALLAAIPGDERTIGLLVAGARAPRSFTRDDANFLQALANTIGAAMQRARAEEQLFQSQRLEALGQLTGGVAHDFNNLLTIVSGNLQMLEERVAADALSASLVRAALRATGRGADLTRKLLAFARRQALQPRPIDVRQLLSSLADVLRRTLGTNLDVRVAVEDELPPVKADPGMLDTALLNLAVNSRDAMAEGGTLTLAASLVRIRAGQEHGEDGLTPGRYVLIAVSDTGAGMSPEVQARAFEPFFTTKESAKGSGLGLSLVYGFAKQSGGHVQAASSPGRGTTISLYLPADERRAPRPSDPGADSSYRGGDETILVVEDDDGVREVAAGFLRRLGYRVLEAADAPEALAQLEREPAIDLLFSDVVLRGDVNGPALAREATERRPGLRVVFTSGYARSALPWREAPDRKVELLPKPYRIDRLARTLRRALDGTLADESGSALADDE